LTSFLSASANPDKVAEMAAVLAVAGIELRPRPPTVAEVDETGDTLEANARLKAAAVAEATGEACIADDTGLCVDALGGAPGVRSGRYAGERASYADNVSRLLQALAGVPAEARTARFRTVALARWPDGREVMAEGVVEGVIATEAKGEAGFGYDPLFVPSEGEGRTFAEMAPEEKHRFSHRGRALRALADALRNC
jgi:XTP/dITP diphosphohydrolase